MSSPWLALTVIGGLCGALSAHAQVRFTYSADGTQVTDQMTRLTWRRCSEGQDWSGGTCTGSAFLFTQEQALIRAREVGWRMPNIKELASIADRSRQPAIDLVVFPATLGVKYWTSSPEARGGIWTVDFRTGNVEDPLTRNTPSPVRLVRSYAPNLSVSPRLVSFGATTTLSWDTQGAPTSSCNLTGGGLPSGLPNSQLGSLSGIVVTGRMTFTLTCLGASIATTVEVIPQGG